MPNSLLTPQIVEPTEISALRHDLRTLVGHVLGYSEMVVLRLQERGQDDFLPDMERIRRAAERILAILVERLNAATLGVPGAADEPALHQPAFRPVADLLPGAPAYRQEAPIAETGKLLVVDDNEVNRNMLARKLEMQGHTVATESGGASALARLEREDFDVVLLDIMMPDIDGREVLSRIKSDPRTTHIPVIMISAIDEMQTVVECIEIGAADFLPKPFNPVLLRARVAAGLRDKRAHDREVQSTRELQDSYRRLQEAEQMRDDLTHMIIHDLRTPMTSVMSGMQTLPLLGDLTEDQQEIVDIAVAGGQKLLDMITDLLNVEKAESGSMGLDTTELHPGELIALAVGEVSMLFESEKLTLVKEVAPDLPSFTGDEGKLVRTLVNLLGNAIKFTPEDGTITIGARLSDDARFMVFSVSDTGDGIPTEFFQRIFEKFAQVEVQRHGIKTGTGLGLTFCKMAVEAHSGHIEVESEPGQGCVFSFYIPV